MLERAGQTLYLVIQFSKNGKNRERKGNGLSGRQLVN